MTNKRMQLHALLYVSKFHNIVHKLKMTMTNDERRRKETDGKETPKPATEEGKARPV